MSGVIKFVLHVCSYDDGRFRSGSNNCSATHILPSAFGCNVSYDEMYEYPLNYYYVLGALCRCLKLYI